jgi:hypothetical protein
MCSLDSLQKNWKFIEYSMQALSENTKKMRYVHNTSMGPFEAYAQGGI